MKKNTILFILFALLLCFGSVSADYEIQVNELDHFEDEHPTWYCKAVTFAVEGLADEKEQKELNDSFAANAAETIIVYQKDVTDIMAANEGTAEELLPHFGSEYGYEVVVDSKEYLVLDEIRFYVGGSSNTIHAFYTFDKTTGKQVKFADIFPDDYDPIPELRAYLFEQMENADPDETMYWLDDDSLDVALEHLDETRHWYLDENGKFIVWFDKYEVQPGAYGESSFVIPAEIFEFPE